MLARRGFLDHVVPNPPGLPADLPGDQPRGSPPDGSSSASPSLPTRRGPTDSDGTSRVLSPSSRLTATTCRACSIPAASLGFSPSEVCSCPEPDTSRLALPFLPLATDLVPAPVPKDRFRPPLARRVSGSACVARSSRRATALRHVGSGGCGGQLRGLPARRPGEPGFRRPARGTRSRIAPRGATRRRRSVRLAASSDRRPPTPHPEGPFAGSPSLSTALSRAGIQGFEPRTRAWLRGGCSPLAGTRTSLGVRPSRV
jgi:hypothetical protein